MRSCRIADSAGFCFGVRRAVELAERALETGPCYCLGELIHNGDEVARLSALGLKVLDDPARLPLGARVLIRSHGAPKRVYELLDEKRAEVIDATCPNVSRIHGIVERAEKAGRIPVVIGDGGHPEVSAICGWCKNAVVFADGAALEEWLEADDTRRDLPLTVVFQTTQTKLAAEVCKNLIKKMCTNSEMFDTICGATSIRQEEARALATECDAVVVIGGRHSANSARLAGICSERCDCVQFIEHAGELNMSNLTGAERVGVTAGASTPGWIIKEVRNKMDDEIRIEELNTEATSAEAAAPENGAEEAQAAEAADAEAAVAEETAVEEAAPAKEMTFDELLEDSIKTIYNGETVTGIVAAITATEVSLDLGTKHSGYIPVEDFADESGVKIEDLIHVGDRIEAVVVRVNDVEGTVMLSKKRLDAVKHWQTIEDAENDGTPLEGVVSEENKGGVVVSYKGIRVFIPASQTGVGREEPMSELLGQTVRFKITEVNRARRRVVGSIRAVRSRERRERVQNIWNEIEVGKVYTGTVKSLTSYGAFVDIGGIDGMVHVTELSWSRIHQPSEVVSVGDTIDVHVISFDKDAKKISLGYRKEEDNPWSKFMATYQVGDIAKVKVVKFMPFGAFAEVMPGVDGLIHISQIANRRIGQPSEVLSVGDFVDAKITNVDEDKQKISLSIRALTEPAPPARKEKEREEKKPEPRDDALVYEISASGEAKGFAPETDETVEE